MTFKQFLMDRLMYILFFLINAALIVLVVYLSYSHQGVILPFGNLLYILVLSLTGLTCFLFIDYVRQRSFFRELALVSKEEGKPEHILSLTSAVTREQLLMQKLMHTSYSLYAKELQEYRAKQEQHLHFANQWVHQMKTPVSVIDLLIQQTSREEPSGRLQPFLQSMREETDRLSHGLNMMLHTARLEKFELDIAADRVELVALVRGIINEYKTVWIGHSLYPKLSADSEEVYVETDRKWMEFVIRQLLTNAIKYSIAKRKSMPSNELEDEKPGRQQLWITVEESGQGWSLVIRDEGIGIPEQDLPRVFDPFFTGANGRTTAESTGMGLFLAQQVCRRLGHRLSLSSREGEGTTAVILFPKPTNMYELLYE
ncbi:HAMP domain-containing sensor histidine kinase [Paenibacillus sp. J2TS4]|uniref:sensor histidine kinase n=1 Tax=Paenibacillus sp. J2TS4 TaxID=2807194 RepID=UPI001B0985AF|nr:sensor histidine kinase [Paenibacillus sp. J2TS4]GIP35723.1 sensor histidine kinase [Paenibacillus sp. J2TS4]